VSKISESVAFVDNEGITSSRVSVTKELITYWEWIGGAIHLAVAGLASGHVVLKKRDSRSAVGWVGLIWLTPFVGAIIYSLVGINRIQRRARAIRRERPVRKSASTPELPSACLPQGADHLESLIRLIGEVTGRPLVSGNHVHPLVNGQQAYPAMLQAIDAAKQTVNFCTYIFDNDHTGRSFLAAFERAVARGVEVRVIIDDMGVRYSWPSILGGLRRAGVRVAQFLPTFRFWRFSYANLRNHRKILVVDSRIAFTGGMNIRDGHDLTLPSKRPVQDLHFRLEGPAVAQVQDVFAKDWEFCTSESLQGDQWFPLLASQGSMQVRGITSGPDDDTENLRLIFLGALACARTTVSIVTPYFLPDPALISALNIAALRGVQVNIFVPTRSNLRLVQWASTAQLWQVLEHGCKVWLTPPPFDHAKLIVVDGIWTLFGSANWDPRSLRLNFEFNLESYDRDLAAQLEEFVGQKLRQSRCISLADVDSRTLLIKLRDGVARLFTPYL
jgi:cardiolipin synthase